MKVLKFGGTSVGSIGSIEKIISILKEESKNGRCIVVVSAMSGVTDAILEAGKCASENNEKYKTILQTIENKHTDTVRAFIPTTHQSSILSYIKKQLNELEDLIEAIYLLKELSTTAKDKIVAYGEILSSYMLSTILQAKQINNTWKDSRELIKTDIQQGQINVLKEKTETNIQSYIETWSTPILLLPGFIASNEGGITTTLGRGGSDFTAAIVASAIHASQLEIWTDVSGVMTADPHFVANPIIIPTLSYEEAMEMCHFGAKVIYPPTLAPVKQKNIPTWVKNTFSPQDIGTLIHSQKHNENENNYIVRTISALKNVALLSIEGPGMIGVLGISKRLFEALYQANINIVLITQASSEHSISIVIDAAQIKKAKETINLAFTNEIKIGTILPVCIEESLSVVALVGDQMKNHPGVSGKMFYSLGKNGVNVRAIAQGSSERNISAVIHYKDLKKAINVLHEEFFQQSYKAINIFIAGVGNVGSKLLHQLHTQKQYLKEHLHIQLNVIALLNSRKGYITDENVDLIKWKEKLDLSPSMDIQQFCNIMIQKNLRNTTFVDVTASNEVAQCYEQLLKKSISIVACNKIAASSDYHHYKMLKLLANEYNTHFLFETNVGAALPIITTLNDLIKTGDKVTKIEAVLSGTLNFVFNNYNTEKSFASIVRQAQKEGYTEPDPRLDLGGVDVARKIMILLRETGLTTQLDEIENKCFLPTECMQGTVEDFYTTMEKHEPHFKKLYEEAKAKKCILKFVATYENNKASVGLRHINPENNLYHLYGKDNIVLFYTNRYHEYPLVIKGAGAGAEVTAAGIFADIMRSAST